MSALDNKVRIYIDAILHYTSTNTSGINVVEQCIIGGNRDANIYDEFRVTDTAIDFASIGVPLVQDTVRTAADIYATPHNVMWLTMSSIDYPTSGSVPAANSNPPGGPDPFIELGFTTQEGDSIYMRITAGNNSIDISTLTNVGGIITEIGSNTQYSNDNDALITDASVIWFERLGANSAVINIL